MSDVPRFPCRCGLRLQFPVVKPGASICRQPEIWIESPRTGKRLVLPDGWWNHLPDEWRIPERIIHAAASGKQIVEFTLDELRAVVRARANYDAKMAVPCDNLVFGGAYEIRTGK